jgi:hypothetical protein
MANDAQLAMLNQGVEAWNVWRQHDQPTSIDLAQASLQGSDLIQVNLTGVNLAGARLNGAVLSQANFRNADLSGANLSGADLTGADLRGAILENAALFRTDLTAAKLGHARLADAFLIMADLTMAGLGGADLTRARLINANLSRAKLSGVVLREAVIEATIFADVDLSDAIGLETVRHNGPSSIGIDTLYRSRGVIPPEFLRGAGVPDSIIAHAQSLIGQSNRASSCFISYSTKDQSFARQLYRDLQNNGVRCWFAPHDVRGGRKIHKQIDEAIQSHDRLLLILSANSMESEWVGSEIGEARQRELKEKRQVLFPISLVPFSELASWRSFDADLGKDTAKEVREYYIPDFSDWKVSDSYQNALRRLIRDLAVEQPSP